MPKPLIFNTTPSDSEQEADRVLAAGNTYDPNYIPGYTEKLRANAISEADDLLFREQHRAAVPGARTKEDWYAKIGAQPQELDVEFEALRIEGVNGSPSHLADMQTAYSVHEEGFRLATVEDLTSRGYGLPPNYRVAEDGSIRRFDLALFMRDGKVARAWRQRKKDEALASENALPEQLSAGEYTAQTSREETRETRYFRSKE